MAEPFGIVGVIGLAIQVTQAVVQIGLDWKDAPDNVKAFVSELGTLKTALAETNTNILLNLEFEEAFYNRPSLFLSQLGPNASNTDLKFMLDLCREKLEDLLKELTKKRHGHRLSWDKLKEAFLAKATQDSVENLSRQCQILNSMLSIDTTVFAASTGKKVSEEKKEQQQWHQTDSKISSATQSSVDQSGLWQKSKENQAIFDWLSPIDCTSQQHNFIRRRQPGTGQWPGDAAEYQERTGVKKKTLFCPGNPGDGKTIPTALHPRCMDDIAEQSISTIASLSSMSSILGPEGAAERLIEVLLGDSILRKLYQEALSRVTVERLERNLRRMFKLFAVELHKEAKTAGQRGAARFVRIRARNSAHIICNKLGRGTSVVEPESLNPTTEPTLLTQDVPGGESDDDSDSDSRDDDPVGLEQLERFIVATMAFESLRSNLRLFVYPVEPGEMNDKTIHDSSAEDIIPEARDLEKNDLHVSDCQLSGTDESRAELTYADLTDKGQLLPHLANIEQEHMAKEVNEFGRHEYGASLKNMLLKFAAAAQMLWRWEPVIPDGKRRVRWKCKCGQLIYDDFEEMQIGAVERLEFSLNNQSSNSNAGANSFNDSGIPIATMRSFISNSIQSLKKILGMKDVELPQHAPETISMAQMPTTPPDPPPEMLYLLLCYREGIYATKLLQLPIADLVSDSQLFTALRSQYKSIRGQWWSFISFRTLTGIRFVRFEMYKKSQSVNIHKKDDIPPADHIEYKYAPVPIDIIPPVGENQLMHFFHHPEHAKDERACLNRFPK